MRKRRCERAPISGSWVTITTVPPLWGTRPSTLRTSWPVWRVRGAGGVAAGIGAHVHIATPPIVRFGTAAQKDRWLAPALRGERIGALAIPEPDAGSDVASVRTRAERVDETPS